eukprot:ANDGO_01936.mRNA.1 putative oligoribonuclease
MPIVWVDCEMSGLDVETCRLLEVAVVLTDGDLNILGTVDSIVIHQSDDVLDGMNDWCIKHHGESGLTRKVRDSVVSERDAEKIILDLVSQHCERGEAVLGGNTVHMDRRFLARYMPSLDQYLHYRIIDVSSVKEIAKRWFPQLPVFPKQCKHRAMDDIFESIAELKYYQEHIFKRV